MSRCVCVLAWLFRFAPFAPSPGNVQQFFNFARVAGPIFRSVIGIFNSKGRHGSIGRKGANTRFKGSLSLHISEIEAIMPSKLAKYLFISYGKFYYVSETCAEFEWEQTFYFTFRFYIAKP